jgi:hypothetical protein
MWMSARFQRALDWLAVSVEDGRSLRHPMDQLRALALFDQLLADGESVPHDAIVGYMLQVGGWERAEAERVSHAWAAVVTLRALDCLRKGPGGIEWLLPPVEVLEGCGGYVPPIDGAHRNGAGGEVSQFTPRP